MEAYHGVAARLAQGSPADAARLVIGSSAVPDVLHMLLAYLAAVALTPRAADAPVAAAAADLLGALRVLHAHGDPSLVVAACGGSALAAHVAVIADTYALDAAPVLAALVPRTQRAAFAALAADGVARAVRTFADTPWVDAIARIQRAARVARAIVTHAEVDSPALLALAEQLALAYHTVLAAERIPPGEASSSASPWPLAWLTAKVDVLAAADSCLCAAGSTHAACVLEQLVHGARLIPDAVALVDAPLLEDLRSAAPKSGPWLGAPPPTPFPGAAWAAARAALPTAPSSATCSAPADPALVDTVLAVLPQLERADVERRLTRRRYADMPAEQVVEAFLDDPAGIADLDADQDPAAATAAPMHDAADDPLPNTLKAAILARATTADEDEAAFDADAPEHRAEILLLKAYGACGAALFARHRGARARTERAQLRDALAPLGAWGDDQIEGWAVMLERDPRKAERLARAARELTPNANQAGAPRERSWGADRLKGGRDPSSARGGRGRGRGGRGGRTRGRGK